MPLSRRENFLRNATLTGPEWIPCNVTVSGASYDELRGDVEDVLARHPVIFPGFKKGQRDYDNWDFGPGRRAGELYRDAWGTVWHSTVNGLAGVAVEHPLSDWGAFAAYEPPDPMLQLDRGPADWEAATKRLREASARGGLTSGGLPHGFMFLRLEYLRGFENLMIDMAMAEPRLWTLCDIVHHHNQAIVQRYLFYGIDLLNLGEDLGTQTASIISPAMFRRWVLPYYRRLIQPAHAAGCQVSFHSDGYTMELFDDLIDAGVTIVNPQDLCHGIDELATHLKGRVCIRLDVDRQTVVPFGKPSDIRELIKEEFMKLGSTQGGLEFICGIYPPTPPENVDAVCSAFEEFRTYWFDGRAKGG